MVVSTRVSHHGHTGNTRHSPRNGFNGFLRALPGDRACLPPSSADRSANLSASVGASGPHDFAVRFKRSSSAALSASIASRPASVTIARAPLCQGGTAKELDLIWVHGEAIYFCGEDWTASISLIRLDKLDFARKWSGRPHWPR